MLFRNIRFLLKLGIFSNDSLMVVKRKPLVYIVYGYTLLLTKAAATFYITYALGLKILIPGPG